MTHFDVVLFWQLYQWAIVTKSSKLRGLNNNHLLSLFNGLWVNWAVLLIWARFGWCWLACSCVCDQLASGPRLAGLEWSSLYLGWLSTFCLGVMRWVDHIFYLPTVYVRLVPMFQGFKRKLKPWGLLRPSLGSGTTSLPPHFIGQRKLQCQLTFKQKRKWTHCRGH